MEKEKKAEKKPAEIKLIETKLKAKSVKVDQKKPEAKTEKKEIIKVKEKTEAKELKKIEPVQEKPVIPTIIEAKDKKKKRSKKFGINVKAKKKTAVARATIKKGKGKIKVNHKLLSLIGPQYLNDFICEPLTIAPGIASEVDIEVSVLGGGYMSQAVATRAVIAKALCEFSRDEKLKQKFLKYDRMLLVDDPRRKEAKKQLGRGARSKKQKSKR